MSDAESEAINDYLRYWIFYLSPEEHEKRVRAEIEPILYDYRMRNRVAQESALAVYML